MPDPHRLERVLLLIAAAALTARCGTATDPRTATITIDPSQRFQTIVGWEATAQAAEDEPGFAVWSDHLFDLAVDELGINRLRLGVSSGMENPVDYDLLGQDPEGRGRRCMRYFTTNDNDDPDLIDWQGFQFGRLDRKVEQIVLPLKRRLEARGERLYLNLEYVAFIRQCSSPFDYAHADPDEYAEFILAAFLHLSERYGFVPDALEVILEPDNVPGWDGERIGRAMVATARRLAAAGIQPDFIAPSTTSMAAAARYVDEIAAVPGATELLSEIAYHRYRGVSSAALAAITSRASRLGIRTAMLEYIGADVETLYQDLAVGNVSAWQQYTLAFTGRDNGGKYLCVVDGDVEICRRTRYLRQYFHYVRPGAVRIAATIDDPSLRALAFADPDGRVVVVVHLDAPSDLLLAGLPAGRYGASVTSKRELGAELEPFEVDASGTGRLRVNDPGILTIYPR